ncbi:Protein of unknown function [Gryllus bimaculatus]|nr:Protein of unknown function [Gryllus bimaculatus]
MDPYDASIGVKWTKWCLPNRRPYHIHGRHCATNALLYKIIKMIEEKHGPSAVPELMFSTGKSFHWNEVET